MRETKSSPSRRTFCAAAGAGVLVLGLPACDPGDPRLGVGGIEQTGGNGGSGGTGGNGSSGNGSGNGSGGGNGGDADMARPPAGDMAGQPPGDMAQQPPPPDMAHGAACDTSMINAGAASSYTVGGTPKYFSGAKAFVVRDAGGLFGVSAICTHSDCINKYQSGKFVCPCHSATFALDGSNPTFPAPPGTLKHHALCVDASGTVWLSPQKGSADVSTRY